MIKKILITLLLFIFFVSKSSEIDNEKNLFTVKSEDKKEYANIKDWLKESTKLFLLLYLSQLTNTLSHELGHALTANFFSGCPINIYLGAKPSDIEVTQSNRHFIKIINFGKIDRGFSIIAGDFKNKIEAYLSVLMGPLIGFLHSYLFLKLFASKKDPNYLKELQKKLIFFTNYPLFFIPILTSILKQPYKNVIHALIFIYSFSIGFKLVKDIESELKNSNKKSLFSILSNKIKELIPMSIVSEPKKFCNAMYLKYMKLLGFLNLCQLIPLGPMDGAVILKLWNEK